MDLCTTIEMYFQKPPLNLNYIFYRTIWLTFCGTAGLDVVFLVNRALKAYIKYITN